LADDAPENIEVLTLLLRDAYRLQSATNGAKAVAIAASNDPPDLILLDVMMPEMDGYATIQKLKENVRTANVPVIFLTALRSETDESKGFSLGAVDYITKPISPSIVLHRVKTHLSLHDQQMILEDQVRQRTAQLEDSRLEIIRRLWTGGGVP
jgi:putative two-component system response regulator